MNKAELLYISPGLGRFLVFLICLNEFSSCIKHSFILILFFLSFFYVHLVCVVHVSMCVCVERDRDRETQLPHLFCKVASISSSGSS